VWILCFGHFPDRWKLCNNTYKSSLTAPMVALIDRSQAPTLKPMTPAEFLQWEEQQEFRHEYVNGEVVAMTGGTIPHNDLALNLYRALCDHVRSRGCRINVSDVKVKVRRLFRYPDLVVTCDDRDKSAIKLFKYPKLIVEVLSPGTEAVDRGQKLHEYLSLSTVQEYVLVNSDQMIIEVYRRGEKRGWLYESYGTGETLELRSVEFSCAIDQIYEDIILPEIIEPDDGEEEGDLS
jgi:Uma2 family endonuclease